MFLTVVVRKTNSICRLKDRSFWLWLWDLHQLQFGFISSFWHGSKTRTRDHLHLNIESQFLELLLVFNTVHDFKNTEQHHPIFPMVLKLYSGAIANGNNGECTTTDSLHSPTQLMAASTVDMSTTCGISEIARSSSFKSSFRRSKREPHWIHSRCRQTQTWSLLYSPPSKKPRQKLSRSGSYLALVSNFF